MLLPVLASLALVLSAPFMGLLRVWLGDLFQGGFFTFMAAAIGAAMVAVAIVAAARIRTHRLLRYAAIGVAVTAAWLYSRAMATGWPEVDIVERVHFIEYGVIAFLFYRAWRPAADVSVIVLPILAGIIVGTIEEWFQWFIPNRVGELRDVALNLVAVVCGLTISIAIAPPERVAWSLTASSRRRVGVTSACLIASLAFFTDQIHLGHEVAGDGVTFRSHYTRSGLEALSADRMGRWKTDPPTVLRRLSREDQYMDEGLWHVRRRNLRFDEEAFGAAWHENRILETYFAPVLDTPSYVSTAGHRWPEAQRQQAQGAAAAAVSAPYTSDAQPYPILLLPPWALWLAAAVAIAACLTLATRAVPSSPATPPAARQ
jgi:hypothetical protein